MITRIKKHMILCRIGELCGIFSVLKKLIWWEFFIGLAIKISIVCNLIEWNILFYLVFESHRSLFIKRGLSLYITFFERILDDINGLKTNSFPKMESRVFWNNVHKMQLPVNMAQKVCQKENGSKQVLDFWAWIRKDSTIQFPGNNLGIESNVANEKVKKIHRENEVG